MSNPKPKKNHFNSRSLFNKYRHIYLAHNQTRHDDNQTDKQICLDVCLIDDDES